MERELVRTKQLVEQQKNDLKHKTENVDTLRVQLNALQLEKSELNGVQKVIILVLYDLYG